MRYVRRFGFAALFASLSVGTLALPSAANEVVAVAGWVRAQETPAGSDDLFTYSIVTAPPLEGIEIELDGTVETTGPDGTAAFEVPEVGGRADPDVADRVVIRTRRLALDDKTRANFSLERPRTKSLAIQYTIEYLVSFRYRDSSGVRMAPSAVDEVLLKSSVGEERVIEPGVPVWLLGTRAAPAPGGLFDIKPVFWTIQDVTVDGLSVANRSQTKFYPEETNVVEVPLLFFSARFEVADAFFGFPLGDTIELTSPSGTSTIHELDADGVMSLDQLARGEYTVLVRGPGLELPRPVAVSRNQTVSLKLYSWLDLGIVAAVMVIFLAVPVLYGLRRRRLLAIAGRLPLAPEPPDVDSRQPAPPTSSTRRAANPLAWLARRRGHS
jgi:hypothetical protein